MAIWALSDLHLCLGNPSKDMAFFGPAWENYIEKIETKWKSFIQKEDLVLIPGDISWAMTLDEAKVDLNWIDSLPGEKVILKGNHDYWWPSNAKLQAALPSSIHFIHNNAFYWKGVAIGGSRLWDTKEYDFSSFVEFKENPKEKKEGKLSLEENEQIFAKELKRLEMSLACLDSKASFRIALTHYPPIGSDLQPSLASAILEKFQINVCVFGHLHSIKPKSLPFGTARGVEYIFASADYIDFSPILVL